MHYAILNGSTNEYFSGSFEKNKMPEEKQKRNQMPKEIPVIEKF